MVAHIESEARLHGDVEIVTETRADLLGQDYEGSADAADNSSPKAAGSLGILYFFMFFLILFNFLLVKIRFIH